MTAKDKEALSFLATHLMCGVAGGLTFGLAVLAIDLGHLRTLALQSNNPVLALGLFFFGLFITFGSVGMGVGVMSLGRNEDD
jgi:hypothetical protein